VTVDWDRFRKCPVCFAPIGKACKALESTVVRGERVTTVGDVIRDRPHSTRVMRTAAARAGGDRG
jgi:hydrogenase maturation factor